MDDGRIHCGILAGAIYMSPIDKLVGESTSERISTLLTFFMIGLDFGFGFWLAYRVVA